MRSSSRSTNVKHVTKGESEEVSSEALGDERFGAACRDEHETDTLKLAGEKANDAFEN